MSDNKLEWDDDNNDGLAANESWISRADIEIFAMPITEDDGTEAVYVRFTGFDDSEEADDYAKFLDETLPLLLFESTTIQ